MRGVSAHQLCLYVVVPPPGLSLLSYHDAERVVPSDCRGARPRLPSTFSDRRGSDRSGGPSQQPSRLDPVNIWTHIHQGKPACRSWCYLCQGQVRSPCCVETLPWHHSRLVWSSHAVACDTTNITLPHINYMLEFYIIILYFIQRLLLHHLQYDWCSLIVFKAINLLHFSCMILLIELRVLFMWWPVRNSNVCSSSTPHLHTQHLSITCSWRYCTSLPLFQSQYF